MDLSVCCFGRNDNFRSDQIKYIDRLKLFSHSLSVLLGSLEWELVLVDYNGPKANPLLQDLPIWDKVPLRSVIIDECKWESFIQKHELAGGKLLLGDEEVPFRNFPVYCVHAYYETLKHCVGKYVLFTSTDNIFSPGLREIIESIKSNTLYGAIRSNTSIKTIKKIGFDIPYGAKWKADRYRDRLLSSSGDFILLSREDALKIGGYLPLPIGKPGHVDTYILFCAAAAKMNLKMLEYKFANIHLRDPQRAPKYNYICGDFNWHQFWEGKPQSRFVEWANNYPKPQRKHKFVKKPTIDYNYEDINGFFDDIMNEKI